MAYTNHALQCNIHGFDSFNSYSISDGEQPKLF